MVVSWYVLEFLSVELQLWPKTGHSESAESLH